MERYRKIAVFLRDSSVVDTDGYKALARRLTEGGCTLSLLSPGGSLPEGTDLLLSLGGDGTFLSAAVMAAPAGVPVLGVNMGRLGFLSEHRPGDVAEAILSGDCTIEERSLLQLRSPWGTGCPEIDLSPLALNEITVARLGAAMLGVEVSVDGCALPAYWADGLLVATSSGSTAYSLSVGGPIVLPESKVLIIAPIASHNMNVRPLVVPDGSKITMRLISRDGAVKLTLDNRSTAVPGDTVVEVSVAQFSLKRLRLRGSSFIGALTDRLHWGDDVRNGR